MGLEAQAEDGNPSGLVKGLMGRRGIRSRAAFNTPVGATEPGPAGPGDAFELIFLASPGDRLSFTTMFGQSNDLFYAPYGDGIALFDEERQPVQGDITAQVVLWDAGTEVNQEPGIGPDQAPRQAAADTGAGEDGKVRLVDDGFTYPGTADVLRITLLAVPPGTH